MRYYGFTNMYLSPIQVGIQNAHCLVAIGREYDNKELILQGSPANLDYADWADNHRTMVCLNGGNQADLIEIGNFFDLPNNPYAWGSFYEDEQSLNGCLTCVGIIIPERIYEIAKLIREDKSHQLIDELMMHAGFTGWQFELMEMINSFRLAN